MKLSANATESECVLFFENFSEDVIFVNVMLPIFAD